MQKYKEDKIWLKTYIDRSYDNVKYIKSFTNIGFTNNLEREQAKNKLIKDLDYFDLQKNNTNISLTKRQVIKDLKIRSRQLRKVTFQ